MATPAMYKNNAGAEIKYRTEPDMSKQADSTLMAGGTVEGSVEGEWLKCANGLYLPLKHPQTGKDLLVLTGPAQMQMNTPPPVPNWVNTSGSPIQYRTEPDMEKKSEKVLAAGSNVQGVQEGDWLKAQDGMYLPLKHPQTGAQLLAVAMPVAGMQAPPGAMPGGRWESAHYYGPITGALGCFVCCCILACPVDSKTVYIAPDGKKVNLDGSEFGMCCGQAS